MTDDPNCKRWTLDKRVRVEFILTVLVQTAVIIWMLASVYGQVGQNAEEIDRQRAKIGQMEIRQRHVATSNARLEERMIAMQAQLGRIERLLAADDPRQ